MGKISVDFADFQEFALDTTGLDYDAVVISPELRAFMPRKLDVTPITLVSLSRGVAVEATFNREQAALRGPGLREFVRRLLAGPRVPKRVRLYVAKPRTMANTFVVATRDDLAEALGADPHAVDAALFFLRMVVRITAGRQWERAALRDLGIRKATVELSAVLQSVTPDRVAPPQGAEHRKASIARRAARGTRSAAGAIDTGGGAGAQAGVGAASDAVAQHIIRERLLAVPHDIAIPVDEESVNTILVRLDAGEFDTPESSHVHEQALVLSASPGFDTLISLDVVRNVVPFVYQASAVKDVLRKMRGRAILADEVGLGKTIEAGIIMMEYILRGLARRVLILCPPPLMSQWMDEMRSKFNMDFVASDDPSFIARDNPWLEFDRIVASTDTAKREPHVRLVQAAQFDLVIVDEAHRCRNKNTLNWKLVNGLKKKYILLLTAMPVQNDLQELFNLITLLRPGQLETASDFSRRFITRGDRLKPKNVADLRGLMKEVMVRNRRATCGLELPRRRAETVRLSLAPQEREFYENVTEFIRTQYAAGSRKGPARLTLRALQKAAGSTAFAAVPTIGQMLATGQFPRGEGDLKRILDLGRSIRKSAKAEALLRLLRATSDKVLVFTGYTATLRFLAQYLERAGVSFATFSGEMGRLDKERAIQAFRDGAQVLLSTESGGEGRNLQFCHVMVNFDLPWNPMKIEQRVGRIHRIGQENEVLVFNLSAADTLEAHVLDLLDAKINMFELVIGELDMILGNVEEEADFEDTIMDLWASSRTEDELRARLDGLGAQLAEAKARYDRTKEYEDNLFGSELGTGVNGADDANDTSQRGGSADGRS